MIDTVRNSDASAKRLSVAEFLRSAGALSGENAIPIVDVRSPGEFLQGHIPGAVNLPLFTDAERAEVGITYKEKGRDEAVLRGLALIGPRLEAMARSLRSCAGSGLSLALVCSRGGMRSASVAWLGEMAGLSCFVLAGGYKAFRRHVLAVFERPVRLMVLSGHTGSGKTEVLHHLTALGERVIDLEGMARHRGSAFGALAGSPQPSCEHFENRLGLALLRFEEGVSGQLLGDAPGEMSGETPGEMSGEMFGEACGPMTKAAAGSASGEAPAACTAKAIWVEDECENLGKVNLPRAFYVQLRAAPVCALSVSREARLARVLAEYGDMDAVVMRTALDRIKRRLGGLEHTRACACLEAGDLAGLAGILLDYYDKAYTKQARSRTVVASLSEDDSAAAAQALRILCPCT